MKKSAYTTYEVSKICRVTMRTIADWINAGKLKAFKTPGGHRRIEREDLVFFLKKNNIPFPEDLADEKGVRILIVDDEESQVKLIARILKNLDSDYILDSASDGFEAGKKVLLFKPDLVVLDLKLPGVDGFHVCRSIKEDGRTKYIKVLAVTGYHSKEIEKHILNCRADAYLQRPFETKEFTKIVQMLLSKV